MLALAGLEFGTLFWRCSRRNEVGLGSVPAYPLGRSYRDLRGRANQQVAAAEVYLLVCGIPVEIRALAAAWVQQR